MKIGLSNLETSDLIKFVHQKDEGRLGYCGVIVRRLGYLFTTFRWLDHATVLSQIQTQAGNPNKANEAIKVVFTNATLKPDLQRKIEKLTQAITPDQPSRARPAKEIEKAKNKEIEPLEDIATYKLPGSDDQIYQQYSAPVKKLQEAYRKLNLGMEDVYSLNRQLTEQEKKLLKMNISDKELFAWQLSFLANPLELETLDKMCQTVSQKMQSIYVNSEGIYLRSKISSMFDSYLFSQFSKNQILNTLDPSEREFYQQLKSVWTSNEELVKLVQLRPNGKNDLFRLAHSFEDASERLFARNQIYHVGIVDRFVHEFNTYVLKPIDDNPGVLEYLQPNGLVEQLVSCVDKRRMAEIIESYFAGSSPSDVSKAIASMGADVQQAIKKQQLENIQKMQLQIDQPMIMTDIDLANLKMSDGHSPFYPEHLFWVNELSKGRYEVTMKTIEGALPPLNTAVVWPSYKITPLRIVSTQTIPPGGGISFSTLPGLKNRYRFECDYKREHDSYGNPLYWIKMV